MPVSTVWFVLVSIAAASLLSEDLYERLRVARTATEREIRVAFKQIALEKHPDKNPHDEEAHAKMIELNQALQILTDPDQRTAYDKEGLKAAESANKGSKGSGNAFGFQDLAFYQNFGLYDSDPAVQVIDYHSWEASHYSTDAWLIAFYDPQCQKCTDMADDWRRVAANLHGAFHVGAVNCDSDFPVCKTLGITALPTVILFKKGQSRNTQPPVVFSATSPHDYDHFMEFAMANLPNVVQPLLPENFQPNSPLPFGGTKGSLWIVGYCNNHDACESLSAKMKLVSMIVNDLLPMGQVNCEAFADLCRQLGTFDDTDGAQIVTYEHAQQHKATLTSDIREIAHSALRKLDPLPALSLELLEEVTTNIFEKGSRVHKVVKNPREYLVLFIDQDGCNDETPELGPGSSLCYQTLLAFRQVLNALSVVWEYGELSPGVFNCNLEAQKDERVKKLCAGVGVAHGNPEVVILKEGALNAYEYHDRIDRTEQVLSFVQETYRSTVHELDHDDFETHVIKEQQTWFVDFFAPWCHHCRDVWPEWNLASKHYDLPKDTPVHFGKINCEEHHELCQEQHIRGYPTFLLYHQGVRHQFDFDHRTAEEFVRFIKETLEPVETEFTVESYERIINPYGNSPAPQEELAEYNDQRWVVDFFAPWCSHCHVMSPKFREAAKALRGVVKFGKLNCELDAQFCMRLGIRAYPTIWRFEPGYTRSRPTAEYPGLPDPKLILDFAMQSVDDTVVALDASTFRSYVRETGDEQSWVVYFWTSVEKDCPECDRVALKMKALASRYRAKELKQQQMVQRLDPVAASKYAGQNKAIQLNFGSFNCRASGQDNLMCVSERIKRFPTVMFYSGANNEQKPLSLDDTLKAISEIDANLAADRRAIVHPFREKPDFQFHQDL